MNRRTHSQARVLCIHYNPNSTGSFVDATLQLLTHLGAQHECWTMIPGDGVFTRQLDAAGVRRVDRGLTDTDSGFVAFGRALVSFAWFLIARRITAVVILDYVYWKPAELLALKLLRIPFVATCHFYKSRQELDGFIRHATTVVVNSERTRQCLAGTDLSGRSVVIHNGIDVEAHRAAPSSLRVELKCGDARLVGFVGALKRIKGIEHFIDAMPTILARSPRVQFVVVGGEHDSGYLDELRQRARQHGVGDRIAFLGHRTDIPSVMKGLDMLVVPSLEEPFGFINVEAGIAEKPVVASRVGGIPEIVVDGETGILVPPGDSQAIADACLRLLEDDAARTAMGAAAARRVASLFSMDAYLQKWSTVVSELAARDRPSPAKS